jgi:hypothetical protein
MHKVGKAHKIPPMPHILQPDHFERSERAKDWTPQDWFENSEGIYSGQTGQFVPKEELSEWGRPLISVLQPGEVEEKVGEEKKEHK